MKLVALALGLSACTTGGSLRVSDDLGTTPANNPGDPRDPDAPNANPFGLDGLIEVPTPPATPTTPATPITPPQPVPVACAPTSALPFCAAGGAAVANGAVYTDVGSAVDSGAAVVDVCPGTHDVTLDPPGPIHLRSASGDPSDTLLTGGSVHPILLANSPVVIEGLGFIDGYADYEGGAVALNGGAIHCSVFTSNHSDYEGGAIASRGDLLITGSMFVDNSADYEGGAISWGDWADQSLEIRDSHFVGNHADYEGQAIEIGTWAYDQVSITGSTFQRNTGPEGVVNFGSWGGFNGTVDSCTFEETSTSIHLGGWLEDGYTMSVTNTTFTGPSGVW